MISQYVLNKTLLRSRGVIAAALLAAIMANTTAHAQGIDTAISQGYQTTASLSVGELVSLVPNEQHQVQLATEGNANLLFGVIETTSAIALSSTTASVQVATSGSTEVLVSDVNGPVLTGDKITISPINGVGMKATVSAEIIGTTEAGLDLSHTVPSTVIDRRTGSKHTVHIGLVPLQVGAAYYSIADQTSSILPPFLQRLANQIAGRDVSAVRVMISLLIVLLGFMSAAVILYTSVRSSILSLGRNPLAAKAIRANLFQVIVAVVGITVAMIVAIYLVLTL